MNKLAIHLQKLTLYSLIPYQELYSATKHGGHIINISTGKEGL